MNRAYLGLFCLLGLIFSPAACVPSTPVSLASTETQRPVIPTLTAAPSPSALPTLPPTLTLTPTLPATTALVFALCSPLDDIALEELSSPELLKNPFLAPQPGKDDGHHGADFAYWSRGDRTEMLGLPVHSVLTGRVAGVVHNRIPYGNAILIETPVDELPAGWLAPLKLPSAWPTVVPASSLYCPMNEQSEVYAEKQSLYLLYAHMKETPSLSVGQPVTCGQVIGQVGTTGNSVNPHLHLETRIGPAGVVLPEMAHYDNAATDAEMHSYCTWRVSDLFLMFDPMKLLSLQP